MTRKEIVNLWDRIECQIDKTIEEYIQTENYTTEELDFLSSIYDVSIREHKSKLIVVVQYTLYFNSDKVYTNSIGFMPTKQLSISNLLKITKIFKEQIIGNNKTLESSLS